MGAAWGMVRQGAEPPILLEKRPNLGGLLATIQWEGCYIDLGPHRIHSENKAILETILGLLEGELVTVKRKSSMRLCGRFIDYPQKLTQVLAALGPGRAAQVLASYAAHFFRRSHGPDSMERYFTSRFGEALYAMVFAPYARKVWREDPANLSADISRQRVASNSLLHTLRDTLFPRDETFLRQFPYPRHGIGTLADRLWAHLAKDGVQGLPEIDVKAIHTGNDGVRSVTLMGVDGLREVPARSAISTLPLPIMVGLLDPPPPREVREAALSLEYSSLVLVYIALNMDRVRDDTWLYFPEGEIPFSRIYELANWSPTLVPKGRTCLCVEVPCKVGDAIWSAPQDTTEAMVVEHLMAMGLFTREKVRRTRSVKVPNIYPIYTLDYREKIDAIFNHLRTIPNLLTTGRGGLFRHNNLDHALDTGIAAGEHLAQYPKGAAQWYDGLHRFENYRIVD